MIKIVSFDLDDTLSDSNFDELIWRTEIPKLYAKDRNIPFKQAYEEVTKEYKNLSGKIAGDWRDAEFWLKHFNLKATWEDLLKLVKHEIKHFPETKRVLNYLKDKKTKLIIITSAEKKFLKAKLESENIEEYFSKTFSGPSDFNKDKKDKEVYEKILEELGIKPEEMLHIGDHKERDVEIPRTVGINAILIDREGKEPNSIKDLTEIKKFL